MKVLIIMPWVKQGGAELIAVQAAYQLRKLGHQVRLAALFIDISKMSPVARGINYVLPPRRISNLCRRSKIFLYFVAPVFLFWLTLKNAKWTDVLFPHSLPSYWLAPIIGSLYRKKIVWLCNEPPRRRKLKEAGLIDWLMWRLADSFLDRWLGRRADQIIVYSNVVRKEVKQRYGKKASLIRLGIDFDFFSQKNSKEVKVLRREYCLDSKFVLLMVGKLHSQKNQQLGIEILKKILTKVPQAILVLVGEGPDEKKLKIKSEKLGVNNKVVFAGFCPPKLVRAWYEAADLILFPSIGQTAMVSQSWGFVPFEALCQQKLSVVSRDSGAAEVIEKERIGFVSLVTVNSFAQAVVEYFGNKKKYQLWAKRGKEWVGNHLTWEEFGRKMEKEILSEVLG